MRCKRCGLDLDQPLAGGCRCEDSSQYVPRIPDERDFTVAVIGFFIPIAGLAIWASSKDDRPEKATSAIIGMAWGIAASVVLFLLLMGAASSAKSRATYRYSAPQSQFNPYYGR